MLVLICVLALANSFALASKADIAKRQATDGPQYSAAGSALISSYVPASALAQIEAQVQSTASGLSVSFTDPKQLVYDCFLAANRPLWFALAIPTAYLPQINAMEGSIDALRGTVQAMPAPTPGSAIMTTVGGGGGVVGVPVTTTDFLGSTVTYTTLVSVSVSTTSLLPGAAGSSYSAYTSTFTDSAGSAITSVGSTLIAGASSIGTQITSGAGSVATQITSGAGSVATVITSGAGGVFSTVTSGAGSVATVITSGAGGVFSTVTSGGAGVVSSITSGIGGLSTLTSGLLPTTTSAGTAAERTQVAGMGVLAVGIAAVVAIL